MRAPTRREIELMIEVDVSFEIRGYKGRSGIESSLFREKEAVLGVKCRSGSGAMP